MPGDLDRRRGPGRRLSDFTKSAEEGELSKEQFLFLLAIDTFKKQNGKTFPTWTDVLEVVRLRLNREPQSPAESAWPRITEAMDRLVPVADRGARIRRVAAVATAMWALLADHERRAENGEAGADNLDEIVAMLAAMLTAPPAHGDSSRESRFDGSHYDRVAGRP